MATGTTYEIADDAVIRQTQQTSLLSAVDADLVPRLLKVNAAGGLLGGGGFSLPEYDAFQIANYGSTNNIHTVVYKKATVTVATLTFTYVGGGTADNDVIASAALT